MENKLVYIGFSLVFRNYTPNLHIYQYTILFKPNCLIMDSGQRNQLANFHQNQGHRYSSLISLIERYAVYDWFFSLDLLVL